MYHTERKFLRKIILIVKFGDHLNMNGELNPCKYGYPDHRIGIPAGIQGAIFSIPNVFIQSGINTFGEDAIAGSSLALNFEYFTYDIAAAFAQAAVTFTSQNYGAGKIKRCKKIFWLCMLSGVVFTEILSVIFMIWDNFFVDIYTASESVAFYALIRLHHVCSLEGLTATYEVESAALRGMGRFLEPSIITILGTVVFRIIWLATVFRLVPILNLASSGGRNCINFLFGQD